MSVTTVRPSATHSLSAIDMLMLSMVLLTTVTVTAGLLFDATLLLAVSPVFIIASVVALVLSTARAMTS